MKSSELYAKLRIIYILEKQKQKKAGHHPQMRIMTRLLLLAISLFAKYS